MEQSFTTYAAKQIDENALKNMSESSWPVFLRHGEVHLWNHLYDTFPEFQILFLDEFNTLIALGNTVPFYWNEQEADLPKTIDGLVQAALDSKKNGPLPNTLSALAAMIRPANRGCGLSYEIIKAMMAVGRQHGLNQLIAPVRPSYKSSYPLIPFENYITWTRKRDGMPLDPWLRVHVRLGARMGKVAPATVVVKGTIEDWKKWTGLFFPESGQYVVSGAFQPVIVDIDKNIGVYEDPNIWMFHDIT